MATTKTIQATVKNRTDTAANWTQKNPVLAEGEIIVVQTSAGETRLKIGDGVKTFTQLPYTDEQIYNNVVTSVNGQTGDVTLANDSKSLGLASAMVGQIAKIAAVDASGVPTAWSPADMPSGGDSEFVVNGTIGGETGVGYSITLDKTADQILAAINEGKSVIARVASEITIDLPLVSFDTISGNIIFAGVINYMAMDSISPIIYFLRLRSDEATLYSSVAIGLDPEGKLPQVSMVSAPTRDMQIATKKYVDDKISDKELILSSSTAGSTKKFKLTIDDTGTLTASEITA